MPEERISQNWPEGLKDRVRKIVGSRGVTEFTIVAVIEKLTMIETGVGENETDTGATLAEDSRTGDFPAPVSSETETGAVSHGRAPLGEGDGSGSNPDDTPAPVFSDVAALRDQLGMVTAAEIPIPSTPRCDTCFSPLIDGECWTCDI